MRRRAAATLGSTTIAVLIGAALLGFALMGFAAACGGGVETPGLGGSRAPASGTCEVPSATGPAAPSRGPIAGRTEIATFAAGCFWGVEAHFASIPGVVDVVVGYTGGTIRKPTYEQVCSHTTGHAEAVRVEYDPDVVSYQELAEAFFAMHDPTTQDRQGPDVGSQYRSAIFFHTPQQEATALAVVQRLERSGAFDDAIVTEITPAGPFWRAEDYHQDYYQR